METPNTTLKEFRFTAEPYDYSIKLFEENVLHIEAIHKEEYLIWFKILDENIKTEIKNNNLLGIQLPPNIIFDILNDFSQNKVSKEFEIKFPNGFKSETSQLMIEIHVKMAYGFSNITPIYLDPKPLEYRDVNEKKLLFLKNEVKNLREKLNNNNESNDKKFIF